MSCTVIKYRRKSFYQEENIKILQTVSYITLKTLKTYDTNGEWPHQLLLLFQRYQLHAACHVQKPTHIKHL